MDLTIIMGNMKTITTIEIKGSNYTPISELLDESKGLTSANDAALALSLDEEMI